MRSHRQAQHPIGQAFRNRKGVLLPAASVIGLLKWAESDNGSTPHARVSQRLLHGVAARAANDVKVPYRRSPFRHLGKRQGALAKTLPILVRNRGAAAIPFIEMSELDAQNRRLQWIEPAVATLNFIHIFTREP